MNEAFVEVLMWSRLMVLVFLCFGSLVPLAAPGAEARAEMQQKLERLKSASEAVVGLDVTVVDGARSADTLGQERSGSGVVIGSDGLILTMGYLIVEADTILVTTFDRKTWPARVVGYDAATGFALIRTVLPLAATPVRLGDAAKLAVGEALMVCTGGEQPDIEIAYLASKRPFSGSWEYHIDNALFTAPAVMNPAGAPLFNEKGELVGIGSLIASDALGKLPHIQGNLFVPTDLLKPILGELQATGSTRQSHRPWLGVRSVESGGHVFIAHVAPDGPAQTGGIHVGDMILAVDGQPVDSLESFYAKLWTRHRPDDQIRMTLQHGTEIRTVTLRGADRTTLMAKPPGI